MHTTGDNRVVLEEKQVKNEYIALLKAEEDFFKDKSRIVWLKSGDKNTKFFPKKVAAHTDRNRIFS